MTGRHTVPTAQVPHDAVTPLGTTELIPEPVGAPPQKTQTDGTSRQFLARLLIVTNVLLVVLLAFQMFHRPQYEYTTTSPEDSNFSKEMNAMGAQGWKTDSCRRASDSGTYTSNVFSYECIMSRPKLGW